MNFFELSIKKYMIALLDIMRIFNSNVFLYNTGKGGYKMKKKDKKFFLEMNEVLLNKIALSKGMTHSVVDTHTENSEGLEGEAYIKSLQDTERTRNYNMNVEYKELEVRCSDLEKHFKRLKSSIEKPTERIIRMEEKLKFLSVELKESKHKNKKLEKRIKELEKWVLFVMRQRSRVNFSSIKEINKEAKQYEKQQIYSGVPEIFTYHSTNMIEGGKYR